MSLLSEQKVSVLQAQQVVVHDTYLGESPQFAQAMNVATALYNFSKQGGAIGAYTLVLSKPIPANSSILQVLLQQPVAVAPGAGAVSFSLGTAPGTPTNLIPVTALPVVGTPTAYVAGNVAGLGVQVLTDIVSVTLVTSVAAITAGAIELNLIYA